MLPRWESILTALWKKSRFTSYFYQTVHFSADFHIPTLALTVASSGLTLIYNPEFLDGYTDDELTGLMVHEMMHVLLSHHHRSIPGKDVSLQNLAQDMMINSYLTEHRKTFFSRTGRDIREEPHVILPKGLPLIPAKYFTDTSSPHVRKDPSWENIYHWLKESLPDKQPSDSDTDTDFQLENQLPTTTAFNKSQSLSDLAQDPFSNSDGLMFSDGNDAPLPTGVHLFHDAYLDDSKQTLRERVVSYASRDENSRAERLYQKISAVVNEAKPAKIKSFSTQIKRFVHLAATTEEWDYSASRFNRRYLSEGIYSPGRYYQKKKTVTVAVDVSGSMVMKPGELETAFGVIESLLKSYRVHLICIDEDVFVPTLKEEGFVASDSGNKPYIYKKGDWKYIRTGTNAATFFAPLFDTVMKYHSEPLIVITDGDIYDLDQLKSYTPTLWAVSSNRGAPFKPPFGKVAVISAETG